MTESIAPLPPLPASRPRRLRRTDWARRLVAENRLGVDDLIWPIGLLTYPVMTVGELLTIFPGRPAFHADITLAALLGGIALLTRDRLTLLSRLAAMALAVLCLGALLGSFSRAPVRPR